MESRRQPSCTTNNRLSRTTCGTIRLGRVWPDIQVWRHEPMSSSFEQFLSANASAVFGLLGAFAGGALSFIASLVLKRRELNHQIRSKLVDRQIAAHERVLKLAQDMRVMVSSGRFDDVGEVERWPDLLQSREQFESWFEEFIREQGAGSSWLTTEAKREVSLVQDYLVTLHIHLTSVPSASYPLLARIVRQDFIDLSSSLEKAVFGFFEHGIHRARPDSLSSWHKYKPEVTKRRLNSTLLAKNFDAFKRASTEAT
jgi:hypothetical protein